MQMDKVEEETTLEIEGAKNFHKAKLICISCEIKFHAMIVYSNYQ